MIDDQVLDAKLNGPKGKRMRSSFLLLLVIGIGGCIGATTNLVNGMVSSEYFRRVMRWKFEHIWRAAVWQGIAEGLIYGFLLGLVFTAGVAALTKMNMEWAFLNPILKQVVRVIYVCWMLGGMLAIILAFVFPEAYDHAIYSVPQMTGPRMGYAWVGGSIWGSMLGGVLAVFYGLVLVHKKWQQRIKVIR